MEYTILKTIVRTLNKEEADKRGAIHKETSFPVKIMMWLGVCGQGLLVPMIFEDGSMDAHRYINEVLPTALELGNRMLGNDWTYQQDGTSRGVTQSLRQGGANRQYLKIWKQGGCNMFVRMDLSLKYSQKRNFFHFFEQKKQNFQK